MRVLQIPIVALSMATACFVIPAPAFSAEGFASVSGRVTGPDGPIAGARVFLETGLEGPLTVTETDARGAYSFDGVVPGRTGIFAYAPGLALDGRGITLALDEAVESLDIRLVAPGTISGTVTSDSGGAVANARISRAVILGASRVGIPFSKLESYGITIPETDSRGRYTIASLPQGAEIAIKIAHANYAQGVVSNLRVGGNAANATLSPGILLTGTILARGRDLPVPNASIEFQSEQPPHDTVVTRSQSDGGYAVRLRPGNWLYQASGSNFSTPSWQVITLDPKYPAQSMSLTVAGTASVRGTVKDAKSGVPIANANVRLITHGVEAASVRTGPGGAYEFSATEGESVVQLGLTPGYLLPPEPAFRVAVTAGQATDLPTFWVAPLPKYSLEVIDAAEQPVAGAIVRVLEPPQLGWYEADKNGLVELSFATLPADGTVIGIAEHPASPHAALFAITRERSADAIVQLQPLATVSGKVENEKGSGVGGAIVEARTQPEGLDRAANLWRAVTDSDGRWTWPAAVPHVPLVCIANAFDESGQLVPESPSAAIFPTSAGAVDVGTLTIAAARTRKGALGRPYDWRKLDVVCGTMPADSDERAALIVHAPAATFDAYADSMANIQRIVASHDILVVLVVAGAVSCGAETPLTLRGESPSMATVFLTRADSTVAFEGFDLPPVAAILALKRRPGS
jgi:hypothetical protein